MPKSSNNPLSEWTIESTIARLSLSHPLTYIEMSLCWFHVIIQVIEPTCSVIDPYPDAPLICLRHLESCAQS